jgi:hypothetical protein
MDEKANVSGRGTPVNTAARKNQVENTSCASVVTLQSAGGRLSFAGEYVAIQAGCRSMNEQTGDENCAPASATTIIRIPNWLKTRKISSAGRREARCTQWHGLCLIPS